MSELVTIDRRFNGPPESGHGGYVCGVLGGLVGGTAEVALRRPPPLDTPLEVVRLDGGAVTLRDGETVIAEGAPATVEIDIPEPVTLADAEAVAESHPYFRQPYFPTCFGCGPKRVESDGLRIFPGRVAGRDIVAAPWTPDASLASEDGSIRPEFVWAALDCPGWFGSFEELPDQRWLLGRLAAETLAPVRTGERCVVVGWPLGQDERKRYAGSALFSADGELRAIAHATWIRIG